MRPRYAIYVLLVIMLLSLTSISPSSVGEESAVKVWSHVFGMSINAIALSPNLRYLAVGTFKIYLINWHTNQTIIIDDIFGGVDSISWSPDSRYILYTGGGSDNYINTDRARESREIKIYSVNGSLITTRKINGYVWASSWSIKNLIAVGTGSNTLQVYSFSNGGLSKYWETVLPGNVISVKWSPLGDKLAFVAGNAVYVYSYAGSPRCSASFIYPQRTVAWSPDGKYIVVGGEDKRVKLLLASTCTKIWSSSTLYTTVNSLDWDGRYIYAGLDNGFVEIFRFEDSSLSYVTRLHPVYDTIDIYGLDANGKYLAVSSWNGSAFILDLTGIIEKEYSEQILTITKNIYHTVTTTKTITKTETKTTWTTKTKTLTKTITFTPTRYTTTTTTIYDTITRKTTATITNTRTTTTTTTRTVTTTTTRTIHTTTKATTIQVLTETTTTQITTTKLAIAVNPRKDVDSTHIAVLVAVALIPVVAVASGYLIYFRKQKLG